MSDLLSQLTISLKNTNSLDGKDRKNAETFLRNIEVNEGFSIILLQCIGNIKDNDVIISGAVFFKNYIKRYWVYKEELNVIISENDRNSIKQNLLSLMLSSIPQVQRQLSEALSIIGKTDYPAKWPTLLPELVSRLGDTNFDVLNGTLEVADSIFYHYRNDFKSETLWQEIAYSLSLFSEPLAVLYNNLLKSLETDPKNLSLLQVMRRVIRIYHSLTFQELPDYFVKPSVLDLFWNGFLKLLSIESNSNEKFKSTIIEQVKSSICETACVFAEKYDDDFKKFIPTFVTAVWTLLTTISTDTKFDELVIVSIKFLSVVVSQQWHAELFGTDEVLKTMMESVVLPNIRLREDDMELFEINGIEYVRRVLEGSDTETRRRQSMDFVKVLCNAFEEKITAGMLHYSNILLEEYQKNPTVNYMSKDASMHCILAITVKGSSAMSGAVILNSRVPIGDYFTNHVMSELTSSNIPILQADALIFLSTFRSQLPAAQLETLLPLLNRHLENPDFVVHTLAASTLEKLISLREHGSLKLSPANIPAAPLMNSLFSALKHPESGENEYIMRAIMRICVAVQSNVPAVAMMNFLVENLNRVSENPKVPAFHHYLFETMSCIIKYYQGNLDDLANLLFPVFQHVLNKETCEEFVPYVYQILALILELSNGVPQSFNLLFPALMFPSVWDNSGAIPALTRLVNSYINKDISIILNGHLEKVLGVFQKLIASKMNDHYGLMILSSLFEFLPVDVLATYANSIFSLIFQRLSSSSTSKYLANLLPCLARLTHSKGPEVLIQAMNKVQNGIFNNVFEKIITVNLGKMASRKIGIIGMSDLLCGLSPNFGPIWITFLQNLVDYVNDGEDDSGGLDEEAMLNETETVGYSSVFSRLALAVGKEYDPTSNINEVEYFARKIVTVCENPSLKPLIRQMSPVHQQKISTLMMKFNINIGQLLA